MHFFILKKIFSEPRLIEHLETQINEGNETRNKKRNRQNGQTDKQTNVQLFCYRNSNCVFSETI